MPKDKIAELLDKAYKLSDKSAFAEAEKIAREVLSFETVSVEQLSDAHRTLAVTCIGTARYEEGLGHFKESLTYANAVSNLSLQCKALNGIAYIQNSCGEFQNALTTAKQALTLAEECGEGKEQKIIINKTEEREMT